MYLILVCLLVLIKLPLVHGVNCTRLKDCKSCASASAGLLLPCVWCTRRHKCGNALEMAESVTTRISLAYDCPVPPTSKHLYTDWFARTRALPFIAATNARDLNELTQCLKTHFNKVQVLEQIKVPCDSALNECMAYVAYSPTDKSIVIAFRSSNSASQLLVEAMDFMLQTHSEFEPVGGVVVSYFYHSFFALWNGGLESRLRTTIQQYPRAEIWVFGHSLGGALASLAAAWISRMSIVPRERIKFVSFGQPRTGDAKFAYAFDSLVPFKYRVVHQHDSITQMPVRLPFTTFTFIHHRYEVFYKNDMELKAKCTICLRAEDPNCSQSSSDPPDPLIHRQYFNISLADWPKTNCRPPPDLHPTYRGQNSWLKHSRSHG